MTTATATALVMEPKEHQLLDTDPQEREHDARAEPADQVHDAAHRDAIAEPRLHPNENRAHRERATGDTGTDRARTSTGFSW